MTRSLALLCFPLLLGLAGGGKRPPVADFFVADSIRTPIYPEFDSGGMLNNYRARVFSPVCEIERCYAVEIDMYWDLIGRFIAFDTVAGGGLTKLDHIPLTDMDYIRLREILLDEHSILANYSKEELVKNTRTSDLDGMTGATIQEVKDLVIDGAAYSCYTLWHIAHGPVTDSLQKATSEAFDQSLVNKLVNMKDQETNYFMLDTFSEDDFENYLPSVLRTIEQGEGYYAKNAIERLPIKVLGDRSTQDFFQQHYSDFNYFTQVALLKKLDLVPVNDQLKDELARHLDERDSYRNELIRSILAD